MNHKPAIIFDLDGTLVDSCPDILRSLNRALKQRNHTIELDLNLCRSLIGGGARTLIRKAFSHFQQPLDTAELEAMYQQFVIEYLPICAEQSQLYPGVQELLQQFHSDGHALGVCTNKPHHPSTTMLNAFNIQQYFGCCVGGDSYPVRKPDPLPLLKTIEKLKHTPETTWYIGDSEVDYQTAKLANVNFIFVSYGYSNGFVPHSEILQCSQFADIISIINP